MDKSDLINFFNNKNLFVNYSSQITIIEILLILVVSLILGLVIVSSYKRFFYGVVYQRSFGITLLMITIISSVISLIIAGNLALSLGMVGALSIIRYRTAVKDPIDAAFIFWAVCIGIANGVLAFKISIISTLFIVLTLQFIEKFIYSSNAKMLFINSEGHNILDVNNILDKYSKRYKVVSHIKEDKFEQIAYDIILNSNVDENKLLTDLKLISQVKNCSIMSKNSNNLDS